MWRVIIEGLSPDTSLISEAVLVTTSVIIIKIIVSVRYSRLLKQIIILTSSST